jgi:hypothetical protein
MKQQDAEGNRSNNPIQEIFVIPVLPATATAAT